MHKMTNPFDADDLFKRSILGSIIGFARKKSKCTSDQGDESDSGLQNYHHLSGQDPYDQTQFVVVTNEADVVHEDVNKHMYAKMAYDNDSQHLLQYRSQQDIYHEIVSECAQLENTASNCSSRSSSQSPLSAVVSDDASTPDILVEKETSSCEHPSPTNCPTIALSSGNTRSTCTTTISIEEFVKLVVTAVKDGGYLIQKDDLSETPEEILRRKRAQNNEAAARYRKRQKELREEAELELQILINKNKHLKQQIEYMQAEIDRLKSAVLNSRANSHL